MIKAGDIVIHKPTQERWFVLGVNKENNRVCIAGYPPTQAYLSDCELLHSGSGINQHEREYRNKEFGISWDE